MRIGALGAAGGAAGAAVAGNGVMGNGAGAAGVGAAAGGNGARVAGVETFCRANVVLEASFLPITRSGASRSPLAPNRSGTSSETATRDWSGRRANVSGAT